MTHSNNVNNSISSSQTSPTWKKSEARQWSNVFSLRKDTDQGKCEKEYGQAVEVNKKIYREITEDSYKTIEACVEHAIENGHHGAFVHYYLEKACDGDDLFYDAFQKCVAAQKDSIIVTVGDLQRCLIIKPKYWRSPDVFLDERTLSEGAYFYTETLLSRQNKDKNDPYWSKPSREALIQYGFYLRLNDKQVNELLLLAGYECLYPCDPADGVCIYFLRKMAAENNEYLYIPQFDGRRTVVRTINSKLIEVKATINRMSEQVGIRAKTHYGKEKVNISLWEDRQLLPKEVEALSVMGMEHKNYKGKRIITNLKYPDENRLRELHLSWDSRKMHLVRKDYVRIPAFSSKLMKYQNGQWNIVEEVEQMAEKMGYASTDQTEMLAMYPTSYMNNQYDYGELENQLNKYGTFKRYGYLYQTRQFLSSKKYRKNLYYTTFPLTRETQVSLEWKEQGHEGFSVMFSADLDHMGEERYYISESAEQFCKEWENAGVLRDEDLLYQVWKLKNLFDEEKSTSFGKMPEFSTLSHILYGRRQIQNEDFTEKGREREKYYEYEVGDKVSVVQMALATGNEELLGKYLCLAGFWNRDMYADYEPQSKECYERLDAFVIYMLKYRDALICVWKDDFVEHENKTGKHFLAEESHLMEKIRVRFPMIRLAMTINRDIQFVLRELSVLGEYRKRDYFYKYLAGMVYPVRFSPNRWYEEYAAAEYFDEETGKLKKRRV